MTREAKTAAMQPQAEEYRWLPRAGSGKEHIPQPLEPQEDDQPCRHPALGRETVFRLLASSTETKYTSVILNHQVSGH